MSFIGMKMNRVLVAGMLAMSVGVASVKLFGADAPAATTEAASQPAIDPNAPIAVIGGRPINNRGFNELMMQVAGMRVFDQVLDLVLVQQACQQVGIPFDGDEYQARVKAEYDKELESVGPQFTEAQRPQVLAQILRQRGITDVEFHLMMERSAGLRALAKASGTLSVSPEEVNEAYEAQYGERADVILIPVKSVTQAATIREAVEKQNRDPMMAAQENGSQAQALTISKNANQVKTIRDTVWQMKEKTLSPTIEQNGMQYVIYLVKMTPSQTASVKFDSVKDKLKSDVMGLKETQWMNQHMQVLRQIAMTTNQIQINDPALRQEFGNMLEAIKRQQEQSATQPAATQAK